MSGTQERYAPARARDLVGYVVATVVLVLGDICAVIRGRPLIGCCSVGPGADVWRASVQAPGRAAAAHGLVGGHAAAAGRDARPA